MTRLQGTKAAITGASSGIGEAAARRLAKEGMDLALGARSIDKLDALAKELGEHGIEAVPIELDVADWASVQQFAHTVEERFGGLDLLFANAGTGGYGAVAELDIDLWRKTLDTNLSGVFYTCKACLPLLQGRDGMRSIAITASVAGTMGFAGGSAYSASKWGVRGFAQAFAQEVSGEDIRVFTLNPGYVNTAWHEGHEHAAEMIQPDDIAELLVNFHTLPATAMVDDVTVWPTRMYDA